MTNRLLESIWPPIATDNLIIRMNNGRDARVLIIVILIQRMPLDEQYDSSHLQMVSLIYTTCVYVYTLCLKKRHPFYIAVVVVVFLTVFT